MAGHSKWANIQHRKKGQDAKRGKLFTKLIREITVAARMGGSSPDANPRLRAAIDKGLAGNMKKDTIENAVKKGAGELDGVEYEEIRYEGYAPGGIALMVDCMTDNRNRSVAEVRHAFSKHGGNMGTDGSVSYMFSKQGIISYSPETDEEPLMDAALEAGADDIIVNDDGSIDVITSAEDFMDVRDGLVNAGFETDQAEITMNPENRIELKIDDAQKLIRLIDRMDDLDDVQEVYHNAAIPDEAYED
jgi:YebC/PmpR family DNA-binding regulatory protein